MRRWAKRSDVFGFIRPAVDAHTLGISAAKQLIDDCGFTTVVADDTVCRAAERPADANAIRQIIQWLAVSGVTRLGFSYRLDPDAGADLFGRLVHQLTSRRLMHEQGGRISELYFAGLPFACERVLREHGNKVTVFIGDETPAETLAKLGIPVSAFPRDLSLEVAYDESRLQFGRDLISSNSHLRIKPFGRSGYPEFGTRSDSLAARVRQAAQRQELPVFRAHVGPYQPDRLQALQEFLEWTRSLAREGFLDVLSIGGSQLTQSAFGEDWDNRPNGGGVPINSATDFASVWEAARPMLVRTYAGTRDIPGLARMYEETINNAWHALSLWWFCKLDERGPYSLLENLRQQFEALRFIASVGKPFEPNVPHHFAFRGSDDVTYVVTAVIAARVAKKTGIRELVLQNMLNTPSTTWGIQDLAKSRAMLRLVRELEDSNFRVRYQTRAGLDYLSHDLDRAKSQLAAATAMMDDVEPHCERSPEIIHVVSYSEGAFLATPEVINESIQITRAALDEYRRMRKAGLVDDLTSHADLDARTDELIRESRCILNAIDESIPNAISPDGLYQMFRAGFLPVPYLWACRDEFPHAISWPTRFVKGGYKVVDQQGRPLSVQNRAQAAAEVARLDGGVPIL